QLVGLVAEVDVHVDQAGLEAGDRGLEVLGAVPEVEGDFVAILDAAPEQRGGEVVRPSRERRPADRAIAVDERRTVAGDGGAERVEDVTEIPAHGGRHSAETSAGASRGRASPCRGRRRARTIGTRSPHARHIRSTAKPSAASSRAAGYRARAGPSPRSARTAAPTTRRHRARGWPWSRSTTGADAGSRSRTAASSACRAAGRARLPRKATRAATGTSPSPP